MSTPTTSTIDWPTVDIYTLRIPATLMWTPPYMQSANQSTINPTALITDTENHGNVLTVHKNSSTTIQSVNRPTPRPNREELETTSVFEQETVGGNDSTGFRSRVVSTSLRDVSYHTTDSTTKSDVSELSPEIMTLSLILMTIHVVNENAM